MFLNVFLKFMEVIMNEPFARAKGTAGVVRSRDQHSATARHRHRLAFIAACPLALIPAMSETQPASDGPLVLVRPATVAVVMLPTDAPPAVFEAAREGLEAVAGENGPFRFAWICDPSSWNADALAGVDRADHDALMLVAPGAPLAGTEVSPAARRVVRDALARGLGLVLVHGAVEAFENWPEFHAWTGARVLGVPWVERDAPFTIQLADRFHPAAEWLNRGWLVTTRLAEVTPITPGRLHMVLRLDPDATDWNHPGVQGRTREFAIAWARWDREARVFCTLLGGGEDVWRDENFHAHLRGGIRWTLGQAEGEPNAHSEKPREFQTTAAGVRYVDLVAGEGPVPRVYEKMRVHMRAWLADGTVVQDTRQSGQPHEFTYGMRQTEQGIEDGMATLRVGGRRRLLIPPEFYSLKDSPVEGKAPPNGLLRVEIERLPVPTESGSASQSSEAASRPS